MIKDHQNTPNREEITLRPAKVADAAAIASLLRELAKGEGRHSLQSEQTVAHDLLGETALMHLLVAEATGGEVVGVLCYYPGYDVESASFGNHLADVIVTKEWRNRGIGRRLMQEAARRTLNGGGEWFSWTVLSNNRKALQFYTELGAQKIGLTFMAIGKNGLKTLAESE